MTFEKEIFGGIIIASLIAVVTIAAISSPSCQKKRHVEVVDFEVGSDTVYSRTCEYWGDQVIGCMCIEVIGDD